MAPSRPPNYLRAALLMPGNFFALAAGAGSAWWLHDLVPVAAAAAGVLVYSLVLSWVPSFRRLQHSLVEGDAFVGSAREYEALLAELAPSQREHLAALSALKEQILKNYQRLPGGRVLVASSQNRLEALLLSFARLVSTLNAYRKFLGAADRHALGEELAGLRKESEEEQSERLREVKQRRVQILDRRLQRFIQADESREVVSHQLATIEDVLRLTHEQSIALRDPDAVSRQLDALTNEVEATDETVREMERFMEFSDEISASPTRARVR